MLFFQFRFHLKILPSPAVMGAKLQIRGTSLVSRTLFRPVGSLWAFAALLR